MKKTAKRLFARAAKRTRHRILIHLMERDLFLVSDAVVSIFLRLLLSWVTSSAELYVLVSKVGDKEHASARRHII